LFYTQILYRLVFETAYVSVKAHPPQAAKEAPSRGLKTDTGYVQSYVEKKV
jgi:hypothetical protein